MENPYQSPRATDGPPDGLPRPPAPSAVKGSVHGVILIGIGFFIWISLSLLLLSGAADAAGAIVGLGFIFLGVVDLLQRTRSRNKQ